MGIWTNGGVLVVDASKKPFNCEDCPCDEECGGLGSTLVVDLGAGGWTDEDCDACDEVQGQYTLVRYYNFTDPTFCQSRYRYEECLICEFPGCANRHAWLRIESQVSYYVLTDLYDITVTVTVQATDNALSGCNQGDDATSYSRSQVNYSISGASIASPFTLSKAGGDSHNAWGFLSSCPGLQVCDGSMPATIGVDL